MITTFDLNENNTVFSENILPSFCNFDNDGQFDFIVTSGTGTVELQLNAPTENANLVNQGSGSLKITNTDYQNTDLVFQSSGNKDAFNQEAPLNDLISICLLKEGTTQNVKLELEIYYISALYETVEFDLSSYPNDQWVRLGQTKNMNSGEYTFKWTLKSDASDASSVCTLYIDCFCIQRINNVINNINIPYLPAKPIVIFHTETLDFGSIASNQTAELDFTMTGAKVGDFIQMVVPVASYLTGLIYGIPDVIADDTVKVVVHNATGGAQNPASGAFKFKIER